MINIDVAKVFKISNFELGKRKSESKDRGKHENIYLGNFNILRLCNRYTLAKGLEIEQLKLFLFFSSLSRLLKYAPEKHR